MNGFAELSIDPVGVIAWLAVGLVAGWLVSRLAEGGYGVIVDMIVGLVGAVIGGVVFGLIVPGEAGFWGGILVAVIGAGLFLAIFRFLGFGPPGL